MRGRAAPGVVTGEGGGREAARAPAGAGLRGARRGGRGAAAAGRPRGWSAPGSPRRPAARRSSKPLPAARGCRELLPLLRRPDWARGVREHCASRPPAAARAAQARGPVGLRRGGARPGREGVFQACFWLLGPCLGALAFVLLLLLYDPSPL